MEPTTEGNYPLLLLLIFTLSSRPLPADFHAPPTVTLGSPRNCILTRNRKVGQAKEDGGSGGSRARVFVFVRSHARVYSFINYSGDGQICLSTRHTFEHTAAASHKPWSRSTTFITAAVVGLICFAAISESTFHKVTVLSPSSSSC